MSRLISTCTTARLSQDTQVTTYPKVLIRNNIIGTSLAKSTTRTNHIVTYTSRSFTGIQYGSVHRLLTIKNGPKTFNLVLLYPLSVSSCRPLQQIQQTIPEEIINHWNFIASDYVSCCNQSSSLVAVFIDDIVMQLFDVNSSLCPLVNEFEKEN